MKHKELKELKKLLEKEKVSEKTLKKVFDLLGDLVNSNKSDFKEAKEFCSKLIKKKKFEKKISKKLEEKLEQLTKPPKQAAKSQKAKGKKGKKILKQKTKEKKKTPLAAQQTRVTKTIMIQNISEKAALTKKDAGAALNSILETITDTLSKGDSVTLIGFGTFSTDLKAQRNGFNPYTKKPMIIPEHKIAHFRVGAKLKEAVK